MVAQWGLKGHQSVGHEGRGREVESYIRRGLCGHHDIISIQRKKAGSNGGSALGLSIGRTGAW